MRLLEESDRSFVSGLDPFRQRWVSGGWADDVRLYLADRRVGADPKGRLAQELLAFALNTRHLLERAQVIYLEDQAVFVDDLIFEAILAWRSDSARWCHEMTALLAALNGAELAYVPRDQCPLAYVPF
jgi:hypothetical protein